MVIRDLEAFILGELNPRESLKPGREYSAPRHQPEEYTNRTVGAVQAAQYSSTRTAEEYTPRLEESSRDFMTTPTQGHWIVNRHLFNRPVLHTP